MCVDLNVNLGVGELLGDSGLGKERSGLSFGMGFGFREVSLGLSLSFYIYFRIYFSVVLVDLSMAVIITVSKWLIEPAVRYKDWPGTLLRSTVT